MSERRKAEFWKLFAAFFSLTALLLSWLVIRAGRAGERIFVMDPSGNVHAGPLIRLSESSEFFHVSSLFATNAALQRSPAGFDLYELLGLYYSSRAIQKLEDDLLVRKEDIRQRNLQQKPIIESVSQPVRAGDSRMIEVRGRLVSAGAYANHSFYDETAFIFVLTYVKNPDMSKAGAYPWICADFELKLRELPQDR
jgi:hypothetical protein